MLNRTEPGEIRHAFSFPQHLDRKKIALDSNPLGIVTSHAVIRTLESIPSSTALTGRV
jgi:hypothetical protein